MAEQPVLELRGVRKTYGELVAVDLLDLEVRPGECVVLIGRASCRERVCSVV